MKDFYSDWKKCRDCQGDDLQFAQAFLNSEPAAFSFLRSDYTRAQFVDLLDLLQNIPTERFLDLICNQTCPHKYDTCEIPQFSDFVKGVVVVPRILEFYPQGIDFTELGERLIASKENEANRKYGENHASLASLMGLAKIKKKQRKLVFPTGLGHFLIDYQIEEKSKLLKAVLLQKPFIQAMISIALNGHGSYGSLMRGLAVSTAKRRRQSIRHLVEFILIGTNSETNLKNIDWTV